MKLAPGKHGKFHEGDSYIVMKVSTYALDVTAKYHVILDVYFIGNGRLVVTIQKCFSYFQTNDKGRLSHDIHFWIGNESSQVNY